MNEKVKGIFNVTMTREEALQEAKQKYLDEVQKIEDEYFWNLPDFYSRVKAYAKKQGVMMTALERTCGYSAGYFSRTMKSRSQEKFLTALQKLHEEFDMDLNYLICGDHTKTTESLMQNMYKT